MNSFADYLCVSIVGFFTVTVMNLFSLLFLNKLTAVYFSDGWWSQWFPAYAVFGVFLLIALTHALRHRTRRQS